MAREQPSPAGGGGAARGDRVGHSTLTSLAPTIPGRNTFHNPDLGRLDDEALALWRQDAEYVDAITGDLVAGAWLEDIAAEEDKRRRARYSRAPLPTRGGIPRETVDAILSRVDLAALCEQFGIPLVPAGAAYRALCPFHRERTGSFYVYANPPHFHCFGCGIHGDAITLVDHFTGECGFAAAVDALAVVAGVTPSSERREPRVTATGTATFEYRAGRIVAR